MILSVVGRGLERAGIVRTGETRVLVACSGGRDSVVLTHAVVTLLGARRAVTGHVDHGARLLSSEDAAFVREFSARLGVQTRSTALRLGPHASEATMRAARYAALEQMRLETDCELILTAHTSDDQAETIMLALVRSARLSALRGMPARRGPIVRPMLRASRSEVVAYARDQGLPFREDPSNLEPAFLRNRIRKELLPLLEARYRAGFSNRLVALGRLVRQSSLSAPKETAPAKYKEKTPHLPNVPAVAFELREVRDEDGSAKPLFGDGKQEAWFDADQLGAPAVRLCRPGDRIQPHGMTGRRKIRDLLREHGVAVVDRTSYPVVVDCEGRAVWLPGVARSSAYPVRPLTQRVWVFWVNNSGELRPRAGRVTVEMIRSRSESEACAEDPRMVIDKKAVESPKRDRASRPREEDE